MQSVAFVSSFVTIVMKSITWHHLELAKSENLSIGQKIKSAPFFLCSIVMKTFGSGTFISFLVNRKLWYLAVVFVALLWAYQVILQKSFGFENSKVADGSITNITSLARPNTDNGFLHSLVTKCFYLCETRMSTLFYLSLSLSLLLTMLKNEDKMIYLYICLCLVCLHFIITNVYLRTSWGLNQLFPNLPTIPSNETIQIQAENEAASNPDCQRPVATKAKHIAVMAWTVLVVSVVTTVGLITMIYFQSLPKGNPFSINIKYSFGLFHK